MSVSRRAKTAFAFMKISYDEKRTLKVRFLKIIIIEKTYKML